MKTSPIPVVLFAYSRPDHLRRGLACLRENNVPLIYAFADGPKTPDVAERVKAVRDILHAIDWCEIHLVERPVNLGLDKSVLIGVSEVFQKHDAIIVFEDDLVCVPGTYEYMCAALEYYKDNPRVMSITGWTLPGVTPSNVTDQPYFDGRSESWTWGTWSRAWKGMDQETTSLVKRCRRQGIDIYKYGADLPVMAKKKIKHWDIRWNYLHLLYGGLCLRPPYSMVNHVGFDTLGTNVTQPNSELYMDVLQPCPIIPEEWPEAIENPECSELWRKFCGEEPSNFKKIFGFLVPLYAKLLRTRQRTFFLKMVKTLKGFLNKLRVEV